MDYHLSRKAERDILKIFVEGAGRYGIVQADKYHIGLFRVFDFLADNPRAVRLRTEFYPPVGIHAYGVHVVIFALKGEKVRIVRVLHGRQHWASWL